jgi:hypothetical protein
MSFFGNLFKTVLTGYILGQVSSSRNTGNNSVSDQPDEPDWGVRLQLSADTNTKIPVVYGRAFTGGKLFDTRMTNDNRTMHYALVLSEKTGLTTLGAGPDSVFSFRDIYWNNSRIVFDSDGITASYMVDRNGKIDRSIDGLVKVYCYNNGSESGVVPDNYTGTVPHAYNVMPYWDSADTADELVFIVVEVNYSKEKNISGLGNVLVDLENSMTLPGDCLYDYMTNTRYGASIASEDIA